MEVVMLAAIDLVIGALHVQGVDAVGAAIRGD